MEQNVAASTQNVAFSAILFLYRDVLHLELSAIDQMERAQRPAPSRGSLPPRRTGGVAPP